MLRGRSSSDSKQKSSKRSAEVKAQSSPAAGQLKVESTISEFVSRALKGPAYCYVKASQIGFLYRSLAEKFVEEGFSASEAAKLIEDNILALCPRCGAWFRGWQLTLAGTI